MKQKTYEPVREFERQTSYCPLHLAWHVLDEARNYFRTPIPEAFADILARRAESVFAKHPFWERRFKSARGHASEIFTPTAATASTAKLAFTA